MKIPRLMILILICFAVTFTLLVIMAEKSVLRKRLFRNINPEINQSCINFENSVLKQLQDKINKLEFENNRLVEIKHQFKNLSQQLVTELKERDRRTSNLPWIFAITPTYTRLTQKADLVRLSHTLLHVINLHWILVEDSTTRTDLVSHLLYESGLSYTHLNIRTQTTNGRNHRGVPQRNLGLDWLRKYVDPKKQPGVVYFMDDDNAYHLKIFEEMRSTRRVSIWGVGLVAGYWEGPIVENGKIVRFHSGWPGGRPIPIDMAGFAVSLEYLLKEKKNVNFDMNSKPGFLETSFLKQLTTISQLEPKADNCSKIYVWHTRTEKPKNINSHPQPIDLSVEI